MTTLPSKLQETTKRLQNLTVWRPNERDPFIELDRWRTDAHDTIEQIYHKKKQQIEQVIEKHEREFMRQLTRQRSLLNSIRKRLLQQKDMTTQLRIQNETSILTDLQRIDNDMNTRLGRGEVVIEIVPINLEDSIKVGLKTYLSTTSSICFRETSTRNQPTRRSGNEVTQAVDNWLQIKKQDEVTIRKELQNTRQSEEHARENRFIRQRHSTEAYGKWLNRKQTEGAFIKKKSSKNDDEIKQETNGT
jgi:exonuclease VII large subunit